MALPSLGHVIMNTLGGIIFQLYVSSLGSKHSAGHCF